MKFSKTAKRAVVVAMCINLMGGANYCWSMLGQQLMEQYNWTPTQTALPYSMLMIVASLWSIVVGAVVDRAGPNAMLRFSGITLAIGLTAAGRTDNWYLVLLAVGVLMGVSSSSLSGSTTPTAIKLVPGRYKGIVTGVVSIGIGWTTFYMAPLINGLRAVTSLQNTFAIVGIGVGAFIFLLSFLMPNPTKNGEKSEAERMDVQETDYSKYKDKAHTPREILRIKETWILFVMFCCAAIAGQQLVSQVTMIAKIQIGSPDGYLFVMGMGICNGLGRLTVSALSDRLGAPRTWRLAYLVTILDLILLAFTHSFGVMMLAVCLMSLLYGGCVPLMWATITDVYGKKYLSSIFGVISNGYSLAALIGPLIASQSVERTGSYFLAFSIAVVFALVGFALSFSIKRRY